MDSHKDIEKYLQDIDKRLSQEMPKVLKEIEVYEKKMASGDLTQNPTPALKFNE